MTSPDAAADTVMYGIDGGSSQGNVNWAVVDNSTGFGFEKVTQGLTYLNPFWAAAKAAMTVRAKATGFIPGAYLFLDQGNGAAQADAFHQHAGDLTGFALAVDVEPWTAGHSRPTITDAKACVTRLRQLYPHHPIGGYPPHWYWGEQDTTFFDWLWSSEYLAGRGAPRQLYPHVPASWWDGYGGRKTVDLLQFTSTATVPGVAGDVDCSAFRGHPDDLRKLVLPAARPPAPDEMHAPAGVWTTVPGTHVQVQPTDHPVVLKFRTAP